jgi:hypothetical protein
MDLNKDIRFWLLLGAGVVAAAWAVTYAGSVDELVRTGTNGYVSMVQGLEPPQLRSGVAGGAGNFAPSATFSGSTGYGSTSPYN